MEQGGVIYWSELYPNAGELDGSDNRNILIPASIKYELIDKVFRPLGNILGFSVTSWEEYDVELAKLPYLRLALDNVTTDKDLSSWIVRAKAFVDRAIELEKDLSIAL